MKKRRFEIVVLVFVIVLSISLVSASYIFYTGNVEPNYFSGEIIKGVFNMSFTSQRNAEFTNNFNGSIKLLELLELSGYSKGGDYTCDPENCMEDLSTSNGQATKQFNLNGNKTIGLLLSGKTISVNDFKMNVESDIQSSCINQITMDVFDDNDAEFFNHDYIDEVCGEKIRGCFEDSNTNEVKITGVPYCERISLDPAPAYRIGAGIKNSTIGKSDLIMEIYDAESGDGPLAECNLPEHSETEQSLSCIAERGSTKRIDALVCIYADDEASNYKIKAETKNPCGMWGLNDIEDYSADYNIYAQRLRYGAVNGEINNSAFLELNPEKSESLSGYLNNYLDENYGGNCKTGCVIPIKFSSAISQQVSLGSLDLDYDSSIGPSSSNKFYDVSKEEVKLTTNGTLNFNIEDIGIKVPEYSEGTSAVLFRLMFSGSAIIEKMLNITSSFTFDITPRFALIGAESEFIASLGNVTSEWDFGDGSAKIVSSNNKAKHIYAEAGEFNVEVKLTKAGKSSTKSFVVIAGNPRESARTLVEKYEKRIINLTSQKNILPSWIADEVEGNVNISFLNESVYELRNRFNGADSDAEYSGIIGDLLGLDIPKIIGTSKSGTLPMAAGFGNIDESLLRRISGANASGGGGQSEELKSAIAGWAGENYDATIDFEVISAYHDSGLSDIATKYKIVLTEKAGAEIPDSGAYLIIGYPKDQIRFMEDYSAKPIGTGGSYIKISGDESIEFALPEFVEISELGAYISPEISALGLSEEELGDIEEGGFAWGIFLFAMSILIVITFVLYIALQEWYKRRYESFLFKEPNQVYNLINFIYNSRVSGLKDDEIKEKLKKAGWKGEQISYAFKKIDGKRTGMWEIPIFKFFENKKMEDEIAKKHHGQIDIKFVKRPDF